MLENRAGVVVEIFERALVAKLKQAWAGVSPPLPVSENPLRESSIVGYVEIVCEGTKGRNRRRIGTEGSSGRALGTSLQQHQ